MQIGRFTPYDSLATSVLGTATLAATDQTKPQATVNDGGRADTKVGEIPPAPTPDARELVDRAAQRVDELRANNRELHFTKDAETNRVVIQVRDLDGKVIKTIPPSKAMDIMAGGEL
jgi:flagellar protein FlaG